MSLRALIVEDEALIALDLAYSVEALGHEVIATVTDSRQAMDAAENGVDFALVDVNLRDGPTGPALGEALARVHGATVIYLTANPRQIRPGIHGPVGILSKPYSDGALAQAVRFAAGLREGPTALPPAELRLLTGGTPTFEGVGGQAGL